MSLFPPLFNLHFKPFNSEQNARGLINYLGNIVQNHVIFYPTSNSLSYLWGFVFLAVIFLIIQLVTVIILVMHYQPEVLQAFDEVIRITNIFPTAQCDGHGHVDLNHAEIAVKLGQMSYNAFVVFIFLLFTLGAAQFFFKPCVTKHFIWHVISVYFLVFTLFRVYYGLSMHSVIFLIVAFGYFLWGSVQNFYAYQELIRSSVNGSCIDEILESISNFNGTLAKYFFYVSLPIVAKFIYQIIALYTTGLTAGFSITPSVFSEILYYLPELGYYLLVIFNWVSYTMLALLWSKDLFNLKSSVAYKLTLCLSFTPFLFLILIIIFPMMDKFFSFFFVLFSICFIVFFSAVLTKRIVLSKVNTVDKNMVLVILNALNTYYSVSGVILGAWGLYMGLELKSFLNGLLDGYSATTYIFISPSMFYNNYLNCFLPFINSDLLNVFANSRVLLLISSVMLLVLTFVFYSTFTYVYQLDLVVEPLTFYLRLWCLSLSLVIAMSFLMTVDASIPIPGVQESTFFLLLGV
jgi:hypothetical protein